MFFWSVRSGGRAYRAHRAREVPAREAHYGSAGRGSTPHLSAEMLKSLAGIEMAHVAYKSVPQAVNDVVGGSIDLTFGTLVTPSA